jgi:hypothetical protein
LTVHVGDAAIGGNRLMPQSKIRRSIHRLWNDDRRVAWWAVRLGAIAAVFAIFGSLFAAGSFVVGLFDSEPSKDPCRPTVEEESFADPPKMEVISSAAEERGVAARSEPCLVGGEDTEVDRHHPGDEILVVCQARGQRINETSSIWDRLEDGTWVADFYVEGTRVGVFDPSIPKCDGTEH